MHLCAKCCYSTPDLVGVCKPTDFIYYNNIQNNTLRYIGFLEDYVIFVNASVKFKNQTMKIQINMTICVNLPLELLGICYV